VQQTLALFSPAAPMTRQGELACATCHQEHEGRRQNLTVLADISCQVCHKTQFESFAQGHPEFKAVYHDRAGIVFDHASHEPRMPGGKLDCAQCHRPDPVGRTMQFTSFEQACAGCHNQGSPDHHGDQIRSDPRVVLQLPAMSLDPSANWPSGSLAAGDTVKPMLQFLIAGDADPAVVQSLKSLASENWDASDWDADPATQARLAKAIKQIVKELSLDDDPAPRPSNQELLRARIARAAGVPKESAFVGELLDQLTAASDMTKAWQQHTLPQLADDLAGKLAQSAAAAPTDNTPWKPPINASGWFIDPDAVSVNFRPSHADAFDKSWIDVLAAGANPAASSKIIATMPNQDFLAALRIQLLAKHAGACVSCHAIQPMNDSYFVNWHAAGHATRVAGYVTFDHKPHLTLFPGDENCSSCHKLATASQSQPSAVALLATTTVPNHGLAPHDKAQCAACHNPTGAPDTCLTCHIYHMTR
jgi:hypothetical protein